MNRSLLAFFVLLFTSGCTAVGEVGRDQLGISVLAVNLRDIYNVPQARTGTAWQVRYKRVAQWMKSSQTLPDIIVLQEAPGFWDCLTDHRRLPDYAGLDVLLDEIRDATGQQYRIAYFISHKLAGGEGGGWTGSMSTGGCDARGGRALLYRPSRIRNVRERETDIGFAYDDEGHAGTHLINSVPCCYPAAGRTDVCTFIDGPPQMAKCNRATPSGSAWTRRQSAIERNNDAVFSRLELIGSGSYIHVYNVHIKHTGGRDLVHAKPATTSINELVDSMERRYARPNTDLLYSPILVGDFNLSAVDASSEFPRFREAMWSRAPDVMGAMFGQETTFRAKQTAYANGTAVLPGAGCENSGGAPETLWSDHCGIFFRIEPVGP